MPFSLGLLPAGEKNEGRANVMDKIAAQTWFSCSIYYSRSEVLYEILGNVKNSEFVRPQQQLHISPASTQNSAIFSTWPRSSSKMRRREGRSLLLAGDLTPNAPHKPSQLWLAWRAAAFPALEEEASPQGLQEELFGVQVVLVAVPASPAVRTVRASSLDVLDTPGSLGMPWASAPAGGTASTGAASAELLAADRHCGTAGGSVSPSTLWAPSLFAQTRPEIEPCLLPPEKCFPQHCYCFFGCYFSCVVIHWCSS